MWLISPLQPVRSFLTYERGVSVPTLIRHAARFPDLRCALQRYEKSLNIDLKSTLFIGKFAKNSRKQSKTCTFWAKILTMKTKNG